MSICGCNQTNFWINGDGVNMLKGEYNNICNPLRLPDELILEFLEKYAQARTGFIDLIDSMNQCEQDRLNTLISNHPNVFFPKPYDQDYEDACQKKYSATAINTFRGAGPRGGLANPVAEGSGLALPQFRHY